MESIVTDKMKGLVLTHLTEKNLNASLRYALREKVVSHLEREDGLVYNLLNYSEDRVFGRELSPYDWLEDTWIIDIDYREERAGNIYLQFLDAKKRMLEDGITEAEICGFYLGICVSDMSSLLLGNPRFPAPSAYHADWDREEHRTVVGTVIPTQILFSLVG